jgi:glycosyltransferase involved in cell wall biosynthesis
MTKSITAPGSLTAEDRDNGSRRSRARILILNGDIPIFPGAAGHEFLNTTRLAALAGKVALVSMVHTAEHLEKAEALARSGIDLYLWESPSLVHRPARGTGARQLLGMALRGLYVSLRARPNRPRDTIVQDFQFRNIADQALRALSEASWQAVLVVQSSSAHWLEYMPRFPLSVLIMHDIRALVYERRARLPSLPWFRAAYWLESRRYRRFERRYCRKFDLVVTVSAADEAWVRANYHPRRIATIPIPVDTQYFHPVVGISEVPGRIVFTGHMGHPPNVDAACYFASQVFPLIKRKIPDAEFRIVGRDPAPRVQGLARTRGVVVTGYVEDIRPEIAAASIVVVPLRFGSGMRNKILEAWSMRKCVISTTVGAEGLSYEDGVNLFIADTPQALANAAIRALECASLRATVQENGSKFVRHEHDPDQIAVRYHSAIASALASQKSQSRTRAVIDLRWMRPGAAGGIEQLSRAFLRQLLRLDQVNTYTVLLPPEARYDFDFDNHHNFRYQASGGPQTFAELARRGLALLAGSLNFPDWRSGAVRALQRARRFEADVGLSITGYIHPDLHPLRNVLVVPDIQHEYHPEFFSAYDLEQRKRLYADSISRAEHVCAISEFTRRTIIERLDVPPDKVTTTLLAADPIFNEDRCLAPTSQAVLAKYRLAQREYLLFPGHTWWHKNHLAAIKALTILRADYKLTPLLVCTGNPRDAHGALRRAIAESGLEAQVRFLGYCDRVEMPGLYEGALALLYPSLFEGFGMPVLEAMWRGCPVVCSNVTSLPEVAGNAALMVHPNSPEQIAEAVYRVLRDSALQQELRSRGFEQARRFSWLTFTLSLTRILHDVSERRFE